MRMLISRSTGRRMFRIAWTIRKRSVPTQSWWMNRDRRNTIHDFLFGIKAILIGLISHFAFVKPGIVLQAPFRFYFAVQKRHKGVPLALEDRGYLMQSSAGKDDRATRGRAIG